MNIIRHGVCRRLIYSRNYTSDRCFYCRSMHRSRLLRPKVKSLLRWNHQWAINNMTQNWYFIRKSSLVSLKNHLSISIRFLQLQTVGVVSAIIIRNQWLLVNAFQLCKKTLWVLLSETFILLAQLVDEVFWVNLWIWWSCEIVMNFLSKLDSYWILWFFLDF